MKTCGWCFSVAADVVDCRVRPRKGPVYTVALCGICRAHVLSEGWRYAAAPHAGRDPAGGSGGGAARCRSDLRDLLAELEAAKAEVESEKMARYGRVMDAMDDAAAARAEARSMRLLVHALLRRLGTDDVELSTAEVEKATELLGTMEIATINRPGWSHPLRVESKLRQDGS